MKTFLFAQLLILPSLVSAQTVTYRVELDRADHHEATITARFDDLPAGPLELRMSRSSPGRYALHEFAKNVYAVHATDGAGTALELTRPDAHGWTVTGHRGVVELGYTVFGDRVDGTYLAVDDTHAHMNMPATFIWAKGLEQRPIELRVVPPHDDWRVATQLAPTEDPFVFRADNLYYFLDSPTEVSAHEVHEWREQGATLRLALHHQGSREQGEQFARMAAAVVREQRAVFGELPEFDYGTYTFIADYLPYASGDGMEHRNSTILSTSRSLDDALRNIGTVSHEFFHAWNVERIRPRSLEPFDFERANMSGALWFAEGFTSYYDDLTLTRAGIFSLDRYAAALSGSLNAIINAPGREFFSPVEMSQRAPFVDAAVSVDPTNRSNIFASYYPYGAVLGLALDLTIRGTLPETTLDDYMAAAWLTYGKPETPYELSDLETLLSEVTGDRELARTFFARHVYDGELPDFERLLAQAGLELSLAAPGKSSLGLVVRDAEDGVMVRSAKRGMAGYGAGMDRGDILRSLGGEPVSSAAELAERLGTLEPGASVEIVFDKRSGTRRANVALDQDPRLHVVTFESAGRELSQEALDFRAGWLSPRAQHPEGLERHCHLCGRSFPMTLDYCAYDGEALELLPR